MPPPVPWLNSLPTGTPSPQLLATNGQFSPFVWPNGAHQPTSIPYAPTIPPNTAQRMSPIPTMARTGSLGPTDFILPSSNSIHSLPPFNQSLLARQQQFFMLQQQSQQLQQQSLLLQMGSSWLPPAFSSPIPPFGSPLQSHQPSQQQSSSHQSPMVQQSSGYPTQRGTPRLAAVNVQLPPSSLLSNSRGDASAVSVTLPMPSASPSMPTLPLAALALAAGSPYIDSFAHLPHFDKIISTLPPAAQPQHATSRKGKGKSKQHRRGKTATNAGPMHTVSPLLPLSFHSTPIGGAAATSSSPGSPVSRSARLAALPDRTRQQLTSGDTNEPQPYGWLYPHQPPEEQIPVGGSPARSNRKLTAQGSMRSVYHTTNGDGPILSSALSTGASVTNVSSPSTSPVNNGMLNAGKISPIVSRRATMNANSDSLSAGLAISMVSSLREAGLVSTLFSPSLAASGLSTPNPSMDGQSLSARTSRRPSATPGDENERDAARATNRKNRQSKRNTFPWNQLDSTGVASSTKSSRERSPAAASNGVVTSSTPKKAGSGSATPTKKSSRSSSLVASATPNTQNNIHSVATSDNTLSVPRAESRKEPSSDDSSKRSHTRVISFVVTSPENVARLLDATADDSSVGKRDSQGSKLASALAQQLALQSNTNSDNPPSTNGSSTVTSALPSAAGSAAPSTVVSASPSAAPSTGVSPHSSAVPSPGGSPSASRPPSPGGSHRKKLSGSGNPNRRSLDRTESLLSPSAADVAAADGSLGGVIYMTRDTVKRGPEIKTGVLATGPSAKEKQKMDEATRERQKRQAERERVKKAEAEEKKRAEAEAVAAKEAARLAREKMKNILAEQGIQRQKEKEAEREREAALAAEREEAERAVRAARLASTAATGSTPSFMRRHMLHRQPTAIESEARRKLRQELDPSHELEEGADAVGDDLPSASPTVPIPSRAHRATSSRMSISLKPGALSNMSGAAAALKKKQPIESSSNNTLMSQRLITASKNGDVDELRRIISEEGLNSSKHADARASFLNRADKNGSSALFHAVWPGHEQFIAVLLEYGANPNMQNHRRNTAMHLAVERGHDGIVRLFLRYGANPLLENSNGDAPFQVLPLAREQLQWASFLYITLEAIWKKSHPEWTSDTILNSTANVSDAGGSTVASGAVTRAVSPIPSSSGNGPLSASGAASPAAVSPATAGGEGDITASEAADVAAASADTLAVLDESLDHSALAVLSPHTPTWLNELCIIFQRKDASRAHTKAIASRVLQAVATTVRMKHALNKSRENLPGATTAALTDSGSNSGGGGGLMALLKQLKGKGTRGSLGGRDSVDGKDASSSDVTASPLTNRSRRRLSNERPSNHSRSPSPVPALAPSVSRRRSNETGKISSKGVAGRRTLKGAAALFSTGSNSTMGSPTAPARSNAAASAAASLRKSLVMPPAATNNSTVNSAANAPTDTLPTTDSESVSVPVTDDSNTTTAAAGVVTGPTLQYKLDKGVAPDAAAVAAVPTVKTFSIFSASLQDIAPEPVRREADFSYWK
jgi:hypothetical protein